MMSLATDRSRLVSKALLIEQISIGWMIAEGGVSVAAGLVAHSVALIAFGFDSLLELIAAVALFVRLRGELRGDEAQHNERRERRALWIVGVTLLLLCIYIIADAGHSLFGHRPAESSPAGFAVAVIALILMPLLARAKLRLGRTIPSAALVADGKETLACAWLSGAVVLGVGMNAILGWWWADPIAALAMIPFLIREGKEAIETARGEDEDDDD